MKPQQYQKLILNLIFWLFLEIVLNLTGLDDVADYSEFVFNYDDVNLSQPQEVLFFGSKKGTFASRSSGSDEKSLSLRS
ncbi:MAG: hypothetical protein AB4372_06320 [Xenococcus sp. (in: cyanobacteria)]